DSQAIALAAGASDVIGNAQIVDTLDEALAGCSLVVGTSARSRGIRPGAYCEPKMTSVGSQDTTGPMTRDELKDLACLGFSADLV
ncbi:hypothetical protein MJM04_28260, partial [Salmonella enterica subsp. enterica serovar Cerro]|nr:hypothetical protein [Salmonella enterica subsp. enterica serovar Cerro]